MGHSLTSDAQLETKNLMQGMLARLGQGKTLLLVRSDILTEFYIILDCQNPHCFSNLQVNTCLHLDYCEFVRKSGEECACT